MNKRLASAVAFAALAAIGSASAADLPLKTPPMAPAYVPAHRMLRAQEHIARVWLNFHFNGPVVAKY